MKHARPDFKLRPLNRVVAVRLDLGLSQCFTATGCIARPSGPGITVRGPIAQLLSFKAWVRCSPRRLHLLPSDKGAVAQSLHRAHTST